MTYAVQGQLVEVLRFGLSALLLLSGSAKLGSPSDAQRAISEVFKFSHKLAKAGTVSVATFEVTAAVLLLSGPTAPIGAAMSGSIGLMIIAVSAIALRMRDTIKCGCFGAGGTQSLGSRTMVAGLVICAVSTPIMLIDRNYGILEETGGGAALMASTCGAVVAAIMLRHTKRIQEALANFTLRSADSGPTLRSIDRTSREAASRVL